MASGEIRLSATTMRRMPVLAQSQDQTQSQNPTQNQVPQGGGTTTWVDPNNAEAGIIACGNCAPASSSGPDPGAAVSVLGPESLPLLVPMLEGVVTVTAARSAAQALGPYGNIFGRARLGGSSIFGISSNAFLRIGWGWPGSATEGTNVFRISGDFIDWLGIESGHIDLFTWPW